MPLSHDQLDLTGSALRAYLPKQERDVLRAERRATKAPIWKRDSLRRRLRKEAWAFCFLAALQDELRDDQKVRDLPPKVLDACEAYANRETPKLVTP